jgi:hypothetical protein
VSSCKLKRVFTSSASVDCLLRYGVSSCLSIYIVSESSSKTAGGTVHTLEIETSFLTFPKHV